MPLRPKLGKALFKPGPDPVNRAPLLSKPPARALCFKGSTQAEPPTARVLWAVYGRGETDKER